MGDPVTRRAQLVLAVVRRWEHSKTWMNFVVVVKRKALVLTFVVLGIVGAAFQYQTSSLSALADCHQKQTRVEGRDDLRAVLFYAVDLSDVLPNDSGAQLYTMNRTAFINDKYPALAPVEC